MTDYLQNARLQALIKTLNIPLPVPAKLQRDNTHLEERSLSNKTVKIFCREAADRAEWKKTLQHAGASTPDAGSSYDGLLIDAGKMSSPSEIEEVYSFLQSHVRQVVTSGKIVLSWNLPDAGDEAFVAAYALTGLTRALAKELGGKGISVNGIARKGKVEGALGTAIFLLTGHSAFISAQVVEAGDHNAGVSFDLRGKKAIVTGGARGIGAETARALARQGAQVGIIDVLPLAEEATGLAQELGGWSLVQDITAPDAQEKLLKKIKAEGGVDIMVNNAGITRDKTIAKMAPHFWQQVFEVNLLALMRITNSLISEGQLAANGRVISLSSISGIAGNVGQTNYSATKAGVIGYTKHLAATLGNGITANAVAPGYIETQMTANLPFFVKEGGRRLSALKQGGVPQDIAEAISFLASPAAQGINGQVLRVCGGSFMGA